jgi:hypothetical protein
MAYKASFLSLNFFPALHLVYRHPFHLSTSPAFPHLSAFPVLPMVDQAHSSNLRLLGLVGSSLARTRGWTENQSDSFLGRSMGHGSGGLATVFLSQLAGDLGDSDGLLELSE